MEKVIMQEKPNKSKKKRKVVMIVSVILAVILLAVIGIVIALKVMARRDNGTGTVYQRPNGSWVGRIYMGRGADGKPKYKCFSGKNQAEVKRKIKEFNQGGCKTDSTKVS